MAERNEWNGHGEEIEDLLRLRTSPIAVRMLETEADIPPGALRPKRDRAVHLAQCQAFSLSRRQGRTVAMLTEDQWCWGPMMAYATLITLPVLALFLTFQKAFIGSIAAVGHSARNSTPNSATCSTSVFDSVTATAKLRSSMARSSAAVAAS